MGLDMYLSARKFVSGYDFKDDKALYKAIIEQVGASGFASEHTPHMNISVTTAYWRKANQIHQWFVDNVQNGVDDCGDYYVDRSQLVELRDLCQRLLDNRQNIDPKLELPPSQGFFFGSYDIDDYYWHQIEDTVNQLNSTLQNTPEDWGFSYHSSW
jgi:hypothetical protein